MKQSEELLGLLDSQTGARRATAAEQAQATHALVSAVIESGEDSTDETHRRYELPPSVEQRARWADDAGQLGLRVSGLARFRRRSRTPKPSQQKNPDFSGVCESLRGSTFTTTQFK